MIDSLKSICSSIFKIITNKFKKLKKTQKIIILSVIVILLIILLFITNSKGKLTEKNYNKVEIGMTYKEVVKLIGECNYSGNIDFPEFGYYSTMCQWWIEKPNGDKPGGVITFIDGVVYSKIDWSDGKKIEIEETKSSKLVERIKASEVMGGEVVDYCTDNTPNVSATSNNFKIIQISRIKGFRVINDEIDIEDCPEYLYTYNVSGPAIGRQDGEFAYASLEILLDDIKWKGMTYNYLNSNNEYVPTTTKEEIEAEKIKNMTGIEKAIQDGVVEDYLTLGVSISKLKEDFNNGNLKKYYTNLKDCLKDAKDLSIIVNSSDTEYYEELEKLENDYNDNTYNEQNNNSYSYNRADYNEQPSEQNNSVSNEQPTLVKTYNTIKKEDSSDYHIIKIYEYSNGEYSYETDWYTYGSIIPSRTSDKRYKTLDEALTSAIQSFEGISLTISDLTEE